MASNRHHLRLAQALIVHDNRAAEQGSKLHSYLGIISRCGGIAEFQNVRGSQGRHKCVQLADTHLFIMCKIQGDLELHAVL